jgi:flagellar hook-length control protein FliK
MKLDFNSESIAFSEKKNEVRDTFSTSKKISETNKNKFTDKLGSVNKKSEKNKDREELDSNKISEEDSSLLYAFLESILNQTTELPEVTIGLSEADKLGKLDCSVNLIDQLAGREELNKMMNDLKSAITAADLGQLSSDDEGITKLDKLIDLMLEETEPLDVKEILEKNLDIIKNKISNIIEHKDFDYSSQEDLSVEGDQYFDLYDLKSMNMNVSEIDDKLSKNESLVVLEKIADLKNYKNNLSSEFSSVVEPSHDVNLAQNKEFKLGDIATDKLPSYITRANIEQDIVNVVKYIKSNGLEQMTIRLKPDELGEMNIKLSKQDGEMVGIITVANKNVYDLVNKNTLDLKQHLESLNINLKEITVNVSNQGTQQFDLSKQDFEQRKYREENSKSLSGDDKENINTENIIDKINENTEDRLDVLA